jgi:hypothetical protein
MLLVLRCLCSTCSDTHAIAGATFVYVYIHTGAVSAEASEDGPGSG